MNVEFNHLYCCSDDDRKLSCNNTRATNGFPWGTFRIKLALKFNGSAASIIKHHSRVYSDGRSIALDT